MRREQVRHGPFSRLSSSTPSRYDIGCTGIGANVSILSIASRSTPGFDGRSGVEGSPG